MGYIIKMPKLGLEMEQGTVLEWKIETGDRVEEGELIAEVESEKSIGEVEARADGTLRRIYVTEGDSVPPGTPIGIVAAPDADISDLEAKAGTELETEAPDVAPSESETADTGAEAEVTTKTGDAGGSTTTDSESASGKSATDIKASPRAQKRAEELDVDLTTVEGTGPQGAITADDVEAAANTEESMGEEVKASPRAQKRAEELDVDLTTVEGTGPQGAITADDVEAAAETAPPSDIGETERVQRITPEQPAAYRYQRTTTVADPSAAEALFEAMEAVRTAFEERVTMTDVLLVVASAALAECPVLNGTYAETTHQLYETQNIALAVDVDGEPAADIISGVENQSLTGLVEARQQLSGGGSGDTGSDQATFTLANAATTKADGQLINPPSVATLEVDPTGQRAVPTGDGVDLQPLVTADLIYDTRAVGRTDAVDFLECFFEHAGQASELVLSTYRGQEEEGRRR